MTNDSTRSTDRTFVTDPLERGRHYFRDAIPGIDTGYFGPMWHALAIAQIVWRDIDDIAAGYGVSGSDIFVLAALLIEEDRSPRPTDLARMLFVTAAAISVRVAKLSKSGLVERVPAPDDHRTVHLRVTGKGRELTLSAMERIARTCSFARACRDLTATDSTDLETLLRTVHVAMERDFLTA
ncbi:MarR family winged helix-turn-helix transcriptional regulator [Niveispirillum fermenti]|uniref:MarR family winged helix-turn-helix transcriptional regulator n=1 Tax=Niveispirillum fermenti TaxID=1233113 RepID=UPI003A8882BB